MYARYFVFQTKPGVRSEIEVLADQVFSLMKAQRGFISVHFLISDDESECGSLSLWESKQDAESAGESLRSKVKDVVEKLAAQPPTQKIYEVYKPKS